jgi:hypothetical protein
MLMNFYEAVDKLKLNLERAQQFLEYLQKKEVFGEDKLVEKEFNLNKWKKFYEELLLLELGYE